MFLCYDITRRETFEHLSTWLQEIQNAASTDALVYLIGNRVDEEVKREVPSSEAEDFCKQNKIETFYETSALTGYNV